MTPNQTDEERIELILDKALEDIVDANFNGYNYALVNEAKQALIEIVREARIDELRQIVETKTKLDDIYGADWRNNYGYNETQVRDAVDWLKSRHKKRIAQLSTNNNTEEGK